MKQEKENNLITEHLIYGLLISQISMLLWNDILSLDVLSENSSRIVWIVLVILIWPRFRLTVENDWWNWNSSLRLELKLPNVYLFRYFSVSYNKSVFFLFFNESSSFKVKTHFNIFFYSLKDVFYAHKFVSKYLHLLLLWIKYE